MNKVIYESFYNDRLKFKWDICLIYINKVNVEKTNNKRVDYYSDWAVFSQFYKHNWTSNFGLINHLKIKIYGWTLAIFRQLGALRNDYWISKVTYWYSLRRVRQTYTWRKTLVIY